MVENIVNWYKEVQTQLNFAAWAEQFPHKAETLDRARAIWMDAHPDG